MKNIFGFDSQKKEVEKAKDNKGNMKSCGSKSHLYSDEISKLAYQFFVDRGGAHGHDKEDWYRAEKIVKQRCGER